MVLQSWFKIRRHRVGDLYSLLPFYLKMVRPCHHTNHRVMLQEVYYLPALFMGWGVCSTKTSCGAVANKKCQRCSPCGCSRRPSRWWRRTWGTLSCSLKSSWTSQSRRRISWSTSWLSDTWNDTFRFELFDNILLSWVKCDQVWWITITLAIFSNILNSRQCDQIWQKINSDWNFFDS